MESLTRLVAGSAVLSSASKEGLFVGGAYVRNVMTRGTTSWPQDARKCGIGSVLVPSVVSAFEDHLRSLLLAEKKGVVFILENIRRMKKAQKVLKTSEVMKLYKRTHLAKASVSSDNFKNTKGILINKRQY